MADEFDCFDAIYATDLRYVPGCWEFCGDAHCCHFSRYRNYSPDRGQQKIPMLAGEYQYLEARGYLQQYDDITLELQTVESEGFSYVFETLSVAAEGCPCEQTTRPTLCRLYPLMPVFDAHGGVIDIDIECTPFEIVEVLSGSPRACQIQTLSFAEMSNFLTLCAAVAASARIKFSLMALHRAQVAFKQNLERKMEQEKLSVFEALARLGQEDALIDKPRLGTELRVLAEAFAQSGNVL
ncbi:MAG: hypothetical protein AAF458_02105 [Pseudomonadota bacterium]